jgi:SAM-dependent methyltransferase
MRINGTLNAKIFCDKLLNRYWLTPDMSPAVFPERLIALKHGKAARLIGGMILKYSILLPYLENSSSVIDMCCGAAFGANLLANSGHKVLAIDSAEGCIELSGLRKHENLTIKVGNVFRSNFGQFDCVTLVDAIEHFPKEEQVRLMSIINAHLKPNGLLLIDTPLSRESRRASRHHVWELSWDDFGNLVDNSGMVHKDRYIINCFNGLQSYTLKVTEPPSGLSMEDYEEGMDQVIVCRKKM